MRRTRLLRGPCRRQRWRRRAEGARIPAMRTTIVLAVSAMVGATAFISAQPPAQKPADELFRAIPQAANIRGYMQRLSARPHHVGSAYTKDNAEWMLARFKEWGWDAAIEQFDVLFPTPKERVLELVEPTKFIGEAGRAGRRGRIRRAARRRSSCRHTTRTRSTATSRRRSCTPTTAASKTTTSSSAWGFRRAAQSCWCATGRSFAA